MPKPPILPVWDWSAIFASGIEFGEWVKLPENAENGPRIEARCAELKVEPHVAALLGALARPVRVVAIAEAWCGDVVRHAPVLERLAAHAPNLEVRYVTREQHPEVFVRFLTNGGEAIPKFVFLSDKFVECGNWGPMPEACRELISRGKACGDVAAARKKVAALYEADLDCREVVKELVRLIEIAAAQTP